jgi:hypothetical protein
MQEVPATVVSYIAGQVGVSVRGGTLRRALPSKMPRSWPSGYLSTSWRKAILMNTSMRRPINAYMIWGIEPRTPDRLDRILASASSAFEERFCTETAAGCYRRH